MHCKASERILYFFLARLPKDRTCTPVCPEALKESKKTSKKALKIEPVKTDTNTLAYCTAVVISHREPGSAQGYIPHRAAPRGQETAENDGGQGHEEAEKDNQKEVFIEDIMTCLPAGCGGFKLKGGKRATRLPFELRLCG